MPFSYIFYGGFRLITVDTPCLKSHWMSLRPVYKKKPGHVSGFEPLLVNSLGGKEDCRHIYILVFAADKIVSQKN